MRPSEETVAVHLACWLRGVASSRVRPRTLVHFREFERLYIRPGIGSRRLGILTPRDIQGLYTGLEANGLVPASAPNLLTWRRLQNGSLGEVSR